MSSPTPSPAAAEPAAAALQAVAQRCRRSVSRQAMLAAGVALLPVPGLDWLTDIGVLMKLLPEINAAFGLSPGQIERLSPQHRLLAYKAISAVTASGGLLIGRVITRDAVLHLLALVGVRLTTQQAAKYVPIAGQAVSAALTYSALRYVCEQHIRQCLQVAQQLQLAGPAPVDSYNAGFVGA